jgi:hypothetical protein
MCSSQQIAGHAGVQNAVAAIAQHIDEARHSGIQARRGWPGQARP